MSDHRIRLTDSDIELLVACLEARMAMLRGARRARAKRLVDRFSEGVPGNPNWILGEVSDGFGNAYAKVAAPKAQGATSARKGSRREG